MIFGGKRKLKKPTPEFLAREDELERHIAAAPPLTVVTAEQLYSPVVGNALQLFEAGDFSALDDRYSILPDIEHHTMYVVVMGKHREHMGHQRTRNGTRRYIHRNRSARLGLLAPEHHFADGLSLHRRQDDPA